MNMKIEAFMQWFGNTGFWKIKIAIIRESFGAAGGSRSLRLAVGALAGRSPVRSAPRPRNKLNLSMHASWCESFGIAKGG